MHRREAQEVEPQVEAVADRVALVRRDAVPLVDGDHQRPALLGDQPEQARVLLGDRVVRIEHADHHVAPRSIACSVLTMLNFSIASLTRARRRTPAVSISV